MYYCVCYLPSGLWHENALGSENYERQNIIIIQELYLEGLIPLHMQIKKRRRRHLCAERGRLAWIKII
jgi:hypothetical protein